MGSFQLLSPPTEDLTLRLPPALKGPVKQCHVQRSIWLLTKYFYFKNWILFIWKCLLVLCTYNAVKKYLHLTHFFCFWICISVSDHLTKTTWGNSKCSCSHCATSLTTDCPLDGNNCHQTLLIIDSPLDLINRIQEQTIYHLVVNGLLDYCLAA